ncbi:hypothetical protein PMPD1_0264 [Paramixta manurensis]|uniref:Uncharacterized protein n=1 Tax=Paramixta manurensis TaxID=2740817 RepID=A0A6M8U9S4_9GAMM|nr:hypothetical protein PMPD1_0264 [Erwiniaceae bacterium PD-1]
MMIMKNISLAFLFLMQPLIAMAGDAFTGQWKGDDLNPATGEIETSMNLWLQEKGAHIVGRYCLIYNSGGKIDCTDNDENNIRGEVVNKNTVLISFNSWFGGRPGKATITLKEDKAFWNKLSFSDGDKIYVPNRFILSKISNEFSNETKQYKFKAGDYTANIISPCMSKFTDCDRVTLILIGPNNSVVRLTGTSIKEKQSEEITYKFENSEQGTYVVIHGDTLSIKNKGSADLVLKGEWIGR